MGRNEAPPRARGVGLRSTPDRIRTCDLRLRRAALYPAELRALLVGSGEPRPTPERWPSFLGVGGISRVLSPPKRRRVISLGPPLLAASSGPPRTRAERAAPRPILGLAPGGVCHATPVTSGPVRSYRTLSPLPVSPGGPSAVCSLRHFPSPRDARGLPGTLPCGARTFLRRSLRLAGDPHSPTPPLTRRFRGRF
jgi:hypothetical protein